MTAYVISNAGGNWNSAASYVAGSGFPVAGDTVTATATSGNLTVNVTSACASIDFTNYVGTFTIGTGGQALTLTSTLKLSSGMTLGSTGPITLSGTATYTSAGKTVPWAVTFAGAGVTYTLADDWTITGNVVTSGTGTCTMNGNTLHCQGSYQQSAGTLGGTTTISLEGSSWVSSGGTSNINISLAPSGTLTASGTYQWGTGTLTYVSGTVNFASSTLTLNGSCTLTLGSSARLNNLNFGVSAITLTLGADLFVNGTFTLPNAAWTLAGAFTFTVKTLASATITATRLWTINIATTMVITGGVTLAGIVGGKPKFQSSSGGTVAVITFNNIGASQSIYLVDATDIDSSKGQSVYSIAGTTGGNTVNWLTVIAPPKAYPRHRAVNVGGSI